ncbi:MAG TPA: hypothetical protein VKC53_00300 [Patescibacteria group bacterium]|nr:hypothetical protein [Patescibacteria group bacterium]
MKKKIIYIVLIIIIATIGIFAYFKSKKTVVSEEIHYHAGFVVFDNGKKVDFSDLKYMNVEPCTVPGKKEEETPEHNQLEKAHLHDGVGDVVHVHRLDSKWGDLFTNIKYPIDYSKVTAFINNQEVADIQNITIKPYDSLVIFIGTVDKRSLASQDPGKNLLLQAVTVDHIKNTESMSESCGN